MPATPPETAYDVFISHSAKDRAWVRGELLPRLESAGLKACIDTRDFRIGAPRVVEVERAVQTSKKTLLILTPAYLADEWANFGNMMLQTLDPASEALRMLPAMLVECQPPLRIAHLVSIRFDDPDGPALAWAQLLAALGASAQPAAPPVPASPASPSGAPAAPPQPASEFNTAAVRELLLAAFGDEELTTFCYDYFPAVHEQFSTGMSRPDKAQRLVEYCARRGQMVELLAQVEQANSYQYGQFEGRLRNLTPPPDPAPASHPLPPNPFAGVSTVGDAAHFVGREVELRRLKSLLQVGSVALLGEPKIGLSSMLRQVARTWQGSVIGPINCQELDSRNDFYECLASALGFSGHAWPPIREKLKASEVLLLIDELDAAPAFDIKIDDLGRFRAVASANHGFRMVCVSHRPLKQVFPNTGPDSPGYSFLQPLTIGLLNDADARKLLEHPWAPDVPQFAPAILDELRKLGGGHPFKLHRVAFHRYEALTDPTYDWLAAYRQDLENLL